jgi:hypothetical protein
MATRSRIAIETPAGKVRSIYCHWDGYPERNGKILFEHYSDPEKLTKLIELGAISSLAPEVSTDKPHTFDSPAKGVVVAYRRDRGEKDVDFDYHLNADHFFGGDIQEWGYLLTKEGVWKVKYCEEEIRDLEDVLKEIEEMELE